MGYNPSLELASGAANVVAPKIPIRERGDMVKNEYGILEGLSDEGRRARP